MEYLRSPTPFSLAALSSSVGVRSPLRGSLSSSRVISRTAVDRATISRQPFHFFPHSPIPPPSLELPFAFLSFLETFS